MGPAPRGAVSDSRGPGRRITPPAACGRIGGWAPLRFPTWWSCSKGGTSRCSRFDLATIDGLTERVRRPGADAASVVVVNRKTRGRTATVHAGARTGAHGPCRSPRGSMPRRPRPPLRRGLPDAGRDAARGGRRTPPLDGLERAVRAQAALRRQRAGPGGPLPRAWHLRQHAVRAPVPRILLLGMAQPHRTGNRIRGPARSPAGSSGCACGRWPSGLSPEARAAELLGIAVRELRRRMEEPPDWS